MALLWVDGFEGYGTSLGSAPSPSGIIARRYQGVISESSIDIETGRISGYCLEMPAYNNRLRTPVLTTDDTMIVGIAIKFNSHNILTFLALYDGTTKGVNFRARAGLSAIEIRCGSTLIGTSDLINMLTGHWYYFEVKVKCHDTNGEYEVRFGGETIASATGVNTKAGSNDYHDEVRIGHIDETSVSPFFDDFYVCDSTGSKNNDFLGNIHILSLYPDGDSSIQWSRSGGSTNYENVDEAIVNDDTDYVEDTATNNMDLYTYDDISSVGTIMGVQINTECKDDLTPYTLIIPMELSGNQSDDAGQVINSTSYSTKMRIVENDPNGNDWTTTNLSAATFGVKVG